jgi:hypothetical protein
MSAIGDNVYTGCEWRHVGWYGTCWSVNELSMGHE